MKVKCILSQDKEGEQKQIKYARLCQGGKVLEVGAAGNVFKKLCNSIAKTKVISIDINPIEKGVIKAEAVKYLKNKRSFFNSIYARHVLEHLNAPDALNFIYYSFCALKPGGKLIIVVPNTNNLNVLSDIWRDFEHKRPYAAAGIALQMQRVGFESVNLGEDVDSWDNSILKQMVRKLRSLIIGFPCEAPDIYIIGYKRRNKCEK